MIEPIDPKKFAMMHYYDPLADKPQKAYIGDPAEWGKLANYAHFYIDEAGKLYQFLPTGAK